MSYDKLKSLIANVNAIETAMAVRLEKRKATPTEKETLSLYSGFGGIKEILELGSERTVSGEMAEQIKRLENLVSTYPNFTEHQRKEVIEGINASVLTAFYTPTYDIDTIANEIYNQEIRTYREPINTSDCNFH